MQWRSIHLLLLELAALCAGQRGYHAPVRHGSSGSSFQTITFGRGNGQSQSINYYPHPYALPAAQAVHGQQPVTAAPVRSTYQQQPVRYSTYQPESPQPTAAYVQPAAPQPTAAYAQPIVFQPSPSYSPFTAAQPTSYAQPATPKPYVYSQPAVTSSPYVYKKPTAYTKPVVNRYQPNSVNNQFAVTRQQQQPKFNLNRPADAIVDEIIAETSRVSPQVVKTLRIVLKNKLIARFLDSSADDETDPCSVISSDLDVTVEELLTAITSSRQELIDIITAVQAMRKAEKNPAEAIEAASRAVSSLDPLLPKFSAIFTANEGCDNKIKATIANFDQIGEVLTTLGNTNLATRDPDAKRRIVQGGEASKIISKVTSSLDEGGFTSLCPDSPTFTTDVFSGVGELLGGLKGIIATFDGDVNEVRSLDETVELIKEGADLLKDLDLGGEDAEPIQFNSECAASLEDVSRALSEVAEVVDVIDPSSFQ